MRNSRTAAGFGPRPCKTAARKNVETSPLESIKNSCSWHAKHPPYAKHSNPEKPEPLQQGKPP